jgi:hypothetical protein
MSTFGTMVAEIREELRRSGMDDAIKRAIGAAVIFHRDKRFTWNELSFSFSTVANQAAYGSGDSASIGRLAAIDSMKIRSPETKLTARTVDYIRSIVEQPSGTPEDYCWYENEITLSPTPSQVFTVDVDGLMELRDTNQAAANQVISRSNILSIPDNYSTAWFVAGFDVIKPWAKGYIYLHHLRNRDEASGQFDAAGGMRADQEAQLGRLGGSGFVTPTRF